MADQITITLPVSISKQALIEAAAIVKNGWTPTVEIAATSTIDVAQSDYLAANQDAKALAKAEHNTVTTIDAVSALDADKNPIRPDSSNGITPTAYQRISYSYTTTVDNPDSITVKGGEALVADFMRYATGLINKAAETKSEWAIADGKAMVIE